MALVQRICPICVKPAYVDIPCDELAAYNAGALAQDAFVSLNADQREIFITGIHPWCWPIGEDELPEDALGWPW